MPCTACPCGTIPHVFVVLPTYYTPTPYYPSYCGIVCPNLCLCMPSHLLITLLLFLWWKVLSHSQYTCPTYCTLLTLIPSVPFCALFCLPPNTHCCLCLPHCSYACGIHCWPSFLFWTACYFLLLRPYYSCAHSPKRAILLIQCAPGSTTLLFPLPRPSHMPACSRDLCLPCLPSPCALGSPSGSACLVLFTHAPLDSPTTHLLLLYYPWVLEPAVCLFTFSATLTYSLTCHTLAFTPCIHTEDNFEAWW